MRENKSGNSCHGGVVNKPVDRHSIMQIRSNAFLKSKTDNLSLIQRILKNVQVHHFNGSVSLGLAISREEYRQSPHTPFPGLL